MTTIHLDRRTAIQHIRLAEEQMDREYVTALAMTDGRPFLPTPPVRDLYTDDAFVTAIGYVR